jgi:hypothetical protein
MTQTEWDEKVKSVADKMIERVRSFITPVSYEVEADWGELAGSASYIQGDGNVYIVTNKHVLDKCGNYRAGHHLKVSNAEGTTSKVIQVPRPYASRPDPIDVAVARVSGEAWLRERHESSAIPKCCIARSHAPVKGEILFFAGYSQERSKSLHTHLVTRVTSFSTQEVSNSSLGDPDYDFHLRYAPRLINSVDDSEPFVPLPQGFSGSLVWNTRFIEVTQRAECWSPECAQVTGILKRWISDEQLLVATRIERMDLDELSRSII